MTIALRRLWILILSGPIMWSSCDSSESTFTSDVPRSATDVGVPPAEPGLTLPEFVELSENKVIPEMGGRPGQIYNANALLFLVAGVSESERAVVHDAIQKATVTCMADSGFDYEPFPFTASKTYAPNFLTLGRQEVQRFGFDNRYLAIDGRTIPSEAEVVTMQRAESIPGYAEALAGDEGPSPTGCRFESEERALGQDLAGQWLEILAAVENARAAINIRASADPAMIALDAEWSICMARRGFPYPTRAALDETPWAPPRPGIPEVQTALADWDCRQETEYLSRYQAVLLAGTDVSMTDNVAIFAAYRATARQIVDAASAYLTAAAG